MAEIFRYLVGDALLVYSSSLLYEAKCLERMINSDGFPIYYIHYKGWKSKYDEWVYENVILDVNDKNLKKMMSLRSKKLKSNSKTVIKAKTSNRKKNNKPLKRSSRKSNKSSISSSQQLTPKKPVDSQSKMVISELLVTEPTSSSFDINKEISIKEEENELVIGNNLNTIEVKQETNKISNTFGTTRNNSLEVPRKKARLTRNQEESSSDQLNGDSSKQQDHGLDSTVHDEKVLIDLTMDETETEILTTIPNESTNMTSNCLTKIDQGLNSTVQENQEIIDLTLDEETENSNKIIADCLTKILTNPATCGLTLNIFVNGLKGINGLLKKYN